MAMGRLLRRSEMAVLQPMASAVAKLALTSQIREKLGDRNAP